MSPTENVNLCMRCFIFRKQSKSNALNLHKNGKQTNMHLVRARRDDIYGVFSPHIYI